MKNHLYLLAVCFMLQNYENYFIKTYVFETFKDTTAVVSRYK